ncbi:MAG: hypothetical protein HQK55_03520 [Deltaproteobacteria bacterium]|nr:hypothetical protein [Deltaproteobacteria bacterium]
MDKKDTLGFGAHFHLRQAYKWPLKVSYNVRNWLVHEGYENGSTPLFKGNRIIDGFTLHDEAVAYLQNLCDYSGDNGKIDACCLQAAEECWPSKDLLAIIEKYHAEIDTMFAGLVRWSVDSFCGQITAFAERDKATLVSRAPTSP